MHKKIIGTSIVIAIIIVSGSVLFSLQAESNNKFQVNEERFDNIVWNNEITEKLSTQMELGKD